MVKFVKISSVLILFNISLNAQWFELNSGTTNILFDICFTNQNTGYVAGFSGTILKTTNAGLNWVSLNNNAFVNLWGLYFVNSATGYAIGESGRCIKTNDGGSAWSIVTLPITDNLKAVYFNDANTGYIGSFDGKIIKTTDGGANWSQQTTGTTQFVSNIHFADISTGFACCSGATLLKTTNGGQNWVQLSPGISEAIYGIYAVNPDTIYAGCENGKIIKSINGGANWIQQVSGTAQRFFDVFFVNSLTGSMVGLNSTIIRTTNGGATWLPQQAGVSGVDLTGVWFTNTITGYICGYNGTILKTITGGFPYPSQPVLTAPPNGSTGVSLVPLLDWDSVTTASTYKLQLGTDSLFTSPVIDTSMLINTQMPVPPGRLLNNTLYFWRVRGVNIVGDGPYSQIFRFRTIVAFPLPPNLLLPLNGASNVSLTPRFDWDSNSVANYYNLQASLDTSFSNPQVNVTGITLSEFTVSSPPLQYNSRYYWRVNTVNDAGTSPWSAVRNFTTVLGPPSAPTLLSPPNGTIGVNLAPTMRWVEDISALSYRLQISLDSTFGSTPQIDTTVTDSAQCTIRQGVLVNIQTYFWRVRTTNPIGQSPWSAVWKFITLLSPPAAPQLVFPPNDTTGITLTPVLNWNDVQYAQSYRVQLATDSLFTTGSTLINVSGLPVSQYSVSGGILTNNTLYYWRVRATNAAGDGPYSAIWKFRTVISPPVAPPVLLNPPNGSFNQSVTPLLDWNDVFGSQGYQVLVTGDSLFNILNIDTIVTPSQFAVPPGILQATTAYYWKVRGFNSGGYGPFSLTWHFTTGIIGINKISEEIPSEFKLHYNYPNPFNPVTKIKFDLPSSRSIANTEVLLIIYDILGREITVLVNEQLKPGYYEISWNASNYPSGVYIYRLTAGEYNDVKKMVLIK